MPNTALKHRAHVVPSADSEALDIMGAIVEFLTPIGEEAPLVLRGTVPPGLVVPLHSHSDPETFIQISGVLEGLSYSDGEVLWVKIAPGNVFHIPGGTKHAFRNPSREKSVSIIVTTPTIGQFFREIGKPIARGPSGPPSAETVRRFLEVADRYGYWNATPEENAHVGLSLPVVG